MTLEKIFIIFLTVVCLLSQLFGLFNFKWAGQQNIFRPANFTFFIWIPIYIGIILFAYYTNYSQNVYTFLLISMVLNLAWLYAATFDFTRLFTIPIILFMYIFTWLVYVNIDRDDNLSIGISLYFGWLNVALFANIISILEERSAFDIDVINSISFFFIAIVILLCFIFNFIYSFDLYFTLVFIWAVFGILFRQL